MEKNDINIFLKKADEYISTAIEKENKKDYDSARNYYLMASKSILEAAKKSSGNFKKNRIKKADRLLQREDNLPKAIQLKEEKEEKIIKFIEKPKITFNEVAGLNNVKEKIKDLIITPFIHPELAETLLLDRMYEWWVSKTQGSNPFDLQKWNDIKIMVQEAKVRYPIWRPKKKAKILALGAGEEDHLPYPPPYGPS